MRVRQRWGKTGETGETGERETVVGSDWRD